MNLSELPYDVQIEIVKYLPLAARIIYQTQICRSIRILFQGRLTLPKPDSFTLVEWRRASSDVARLLQKDEQQKEELTEEARIEVGLSNELLLSTTKKKSIWDTSPSSTPRPAPASTFLSPLTSLEYFTSSTIQECKSVPFADHSDVDLFARCMRLLGKINSQKQLQTQQPPLPPLHLSTPLVIVPIRFLSLLSRTGFKVASLLYLLQHEPALFSVETVLMTSAGNAEMALWSIFQPVQQRFRWQSTTLNTTSTCIETQAIVVPGPRAQRGQGLQSGFNCLCFNINRLQSSPFHVIFHDWYDEAEAEGTQDMLQNSQITCNICKERIDF